MYQVSWFWSVNLFKDPLVIPVRQTLLFLDDRKEKLATESYRDVFYVYVFQIGRQGRATGRHTLTTSVELSSLFLFQSFKAGHQFYFELIV